MTVRRRLSCLVAVLMSGAGGSVLVAEESKAQEASGAYAYVTTNLNERAGPGTRFPPLVVIPARAQVTINGCLSDLSWCEGTYDDTRGWMSADYLRLYDYTEQAWVEVEDYARSTRLARYTFDLDRYWTAHYRDRTFYPQRAAWLVAPSSPSVDNGVFYRELSPYGRWTQLEGRYVWMPQVREGWRPYTEGRWQYTERYGWTWVSNEPFGWATYHYGRWAYSNRLGWVWVPGTQWAPAWVAWRGSDDHLAWAPLPPDAGPGYAIDEGYDTIPSYYWQVVPSASFLRPNLAEVVLRNDDRDWRPSLDRARPIGNVTVVNNTVVNNVINIKYVEEKTQTRVVPREVVITSDESRQAESSDEVVRIYQPPVTEAPATETPPAVLPADVAAEQSQTAGQAGDELATDDRMPEAAEAEAEAQVPPTEAPPLAEDETPVAEEQPAEPPAGEAAPPPAVEPPPAGEAPPPPATDAPAEPTAEPPPAPPAEEAPPPADTPAPAAEEPPPADATPVPETEPSPAAEPPTPAEQPPPAPALEEPAPQAEPPPPPAAEEPPAPVEEAPPPPAADEPPPPPAVEEAPAPVEEAPPPPAADEPPPPPAVEEPPVPPAAESPAVEEPPLPPPAADEPPPAPAAEEPPAPVEEAPPPPAADEPPPPAADEPPPPPAAEEPPPPPAAEEPPPAPEAAEPPPPAAEEQGAQPPAQDCGEDMRLNKKGECVPRKNP